MSGKAKTIDAYIAAFPAEVKQILEQIRAIVKKVAPDAEETISYDIPTFNLGGTYLVYFAAWKKHIALYPVSPQLAEQLSEDLSKYKGSKGSVHFPLNKPIPFDLIEKIVAWRLKEHASEQHK